jgi:pyruvate formate lyase activating enzyme
MTTSIRCTICPKGCELRSGEIGDCRVRQHIDGKIIFTTFNKPSALNIDPIEKKPLYHVLPGSNTLSIGTAGCNLHCKQCQNWQLSQNDPVLNQSLNGEQIASIAIENNCPSVSYTYAEPLVSFEYTLECCKIISKAGLKNIAVTAAYINPDPLRELCTYIDAANVDLKSFSDDFYRTICDARLTPVLNALKIMKECGVYIELTYLIIPTLNDSPEEIKTMCGWVNKNLGNETPIHFSRFFPQHELQHLPPTPIESLLNAQSLANEIGLLYVYSGNMTDRGGESTFCPGCQTKLIDRRGYKIISNRILDGKCPDCNQSISGIWN